jgi:hypothetical protein
MSYYWNIQARNIKTRQTVKQQNLWGYMTVNQAEAVKLAEKFAADISARTRETWVPQIKWVKNTG